MLYFNDVKKYDTFSSQSTENQPFHFFWDTRYSSRVDGHGKVPKGLTPHIIQILCVN